MVRVRFNNKQLDRLSEFFSNFAILSMASLVFPNIFGIDKLDQLDLKSGVLLTVASLLISMILLKRKL